MASQLSILLAGHILTVYLNLLHRTKNIKVTILKLLRRLLSLTSIKTSLPKTKTGCGKLVELYLTMTSPVQVICLWEMPKWKTNPVTLNLPTSKVPSILARLLHYRQELIVFLWWNWLIILGESARLAMQGTDRALGRISTWNQCHLCWSWSEMLAATICLFCCFTSQVNSYCHCGTVSSPNHTFSWAGLNKRLTSNSCTYFRL